MKKPKLLLKVDSNNRGKIYFNHKWLTDIVRADIKAFPFNYSIEIEQYKRDKNGRFIIENNEVLTTTKSLKIEKR